MSIFSRNRASTAAKLDEVAIIRDRVRAMREQIGRREVQLTDLFSMLSEDERKAYWSPEAESIQK